MPRNAYIEYTQQDVRTRRDNMYWRENNGWYFRNYVRRSSRHFWKLSSEPGYIYRVGCILFYMSHHSIRRNWFAKLEIKIFLINSKDRLNLPSNAINVKLNRCRITVKRASWNIYKVSTCVSTWITRREREICNAETRGRKASRKLGVCTFAISFPWIASMLSNRRVNDPDRLIVC